MIDSLIKEGKEKRVNCYHDKPFPSVSGLDYEEWVEKVRRYLQQHYPNSKQTEEFERIERSKNISSVTKCEKLIAILVALRDIPDK